MSTSTPRARTVRYESPRLKADSELTKRVTAISDAPDIFRDAKRVIEGWANTSPKLTATQKDGPQELALSASINPLVRRRDALEQVLKQLGAVLKEYPLGGNFRLSAQIVNLQPSDPPVPNAPKYQVNFHLIFADQSRALSASKRIKELTPELLVALQESCHLPDEVANGRVH